MEEVFVAVLVFWLVVVVVDVSIESVVGVTICSIEVMSATIVEDSIIEAVVEETTRVVLLTS